MSVYFISGIDTDIGKTYATGALARTLLQHSQSNESTVMTQKLVQTGCEGISEDINCHRDMMGIPIQTVDKQGLTCPYVFSKPASPHLSSLIEGVKIDSDVITQATKRLSAQYEIVLLEGAGGLMVPLNDSLLTIDYVASQGYPVILVTSGRLGSINHTLLSIEALKQRQLPLHAIIYNEWQPEKRLVSDYEPDAQITDSTKDYLQKYLKREYPDTHWVNLPSFNSQLNVDAEQCESEQKNAYSLASYVSCLLKL
ncbi:dethiobiotin synthase [Psychrobacter sp. FDAARGOS_221]|uniref:dethiobiotin synthase n=1 Tax=Psychrobacter sp. FDAARGOS_221 TaxID=1975705 RepID=UPI000BB580A7|nr:dethiobiotin synthase [Psychrobacter sp. FDAARGOS_221]PNK59614.1 ATP-dependent dethiobiotin synthetase BioD [Psychrobacter sp. FDAARGOS_221]